METGKPIDGGGSDLKDWQRGMLGSSAIARFKITQGTIDEMVSKYNPDLPNCPECGLYCKLKEIKLGDGNKIYFPTCNAHPDNKDHGYGKFSKHGVRAPMGRKAGSKNQAKPVTETKVEVEIKKTEEKIQSEKVDVKVTGKTVHSQIVRASKYVIAGERNIYFTGPAGTGKSTGAEDLFEIMKTQEKWSNDSVIHKLTVSMSTFVSDLAGFLDRLNKGEFVVTELVQSLQKPGVVVVDEADKGNPNLAGFWNVILANNEINTPGGNYKRHPDNVIVFIGNTTGHQPSKQYSGSIRQDYATLDRFRCFNVGFEEKVEKAAIPNLNHDLYIAMKLLRQKAAQTGLQRILGTRWLRRANQAMIVEGMSDVRNAIKSVMVDESWSNDEMQSVGFN